MNANSTPSHPQAFRLFKIVLLLIASVGIAARVFAPQQATKPAQADWVEEQGKTMGSTFRLRFALPFDPQSGPQLLEIGNQLRTIISETERLISTWQTDSQLSQFNRQTSTAWYPIDLRTVEMLEQAAALATVDKRFDVTVAPLSDLWGFGPGSTRGTEPTPAAIDDCLQHVGMDKLEFRRGPPALRKIDPDLRLDLSAVAAGYVADKLAQALRSQSVIDFYVEVAGEIVTGGHNQSGEEWRVGIAEPVMGSTGIHTKLNVSNCAIATSGNYRQFIKIDGESLGHIIDPTTGCPTTTDILSATVIDNACARADGIATLLMTMPASEAMELARQQGWRVLLLVDDSTGGIKEIRSAEMQLGSY